MGTQKKSERVLGPYRRRDKFRVVIIRGDGVRTYRDVETEAQARRLIESIGQLLATTAGITIGAAIAEYRAYLEGDKENKPGSIEDTIYRLGRVFPDRDIPVASLKSKDDGQRLYDALRAYRIPQKNKPPEQWRGYAADSHRNMLAEARTFLRWCIERKYAKINALEGVAGVGRRKKGQDKPQLRIDEARKWTETAIEAAKQGSEGAIAALMTELLGVRCNEVVSRVVRDLDDDARLLWIPDSKTEAGRRTLEVPAMLRVFLRRLARGKAPMDYLFGEGKTPRDRNYPTKWVKKLCQRAGVPVVGAHAMRRLHSTVAVEAGATGHLVAAALGHVSYSTTTESYVARGTQQDINRRKAADLLHRAGPKRAEDDDTVIHERGSRAGDR